MLPAQNISMDNGININTACPNKNLTIFARKIQGCKWKFWNELGLHFNSKGLKFVYRLFHVNR